MHTPNTSQKSKRIYTILIAFSPAERLLLYIFSIILTFSTSLLLIQANRALSVIVPTHAGTLQEGQIGTIRFVNPVLALSNIDQSISMLVYSGLMRKDAHGSLIPDLASSYTISPDGKQYTFVMRDSVTFHDGTPVTAYDVVYTIHMIQNPAIKSPRRLDWVGVDVAAPDAHTVLFTLPEPYAPFLYNTTIGILPHHLWDKVSDTDFSFSPYNTDAVGSGPFQKAEIQRDQQGLITEYTLRSFSRFALGYPYLDTITLVPYPDETSLEKAYAEGAVESLSGAQPPIASSTKTHATITIPLPRVFGIFFNQNHNTLLAESTVRKALVTAIDQDILAQHVLGSAAVPLYGPIPPHTYMDTTFSSTPSTSTRPAEDVSATNDAKLAQAARILQLGGWTQSSSTGQWTKDKKTLAITLATGDTPELTLSSRAVTNAWQKLGISVTRAVYPTTELQTKIIQPREYDAVLFGEAVGSDADLYPFWHSKERNDPGLNLAMYTNSTVDTLLTSARSTIDPTARASLYTQAAEVIATEYPAVFLYSPTFSYILPTSIQGVSFGSLSNPAERFGNVYNWYTQSEHVWKFLVPYTRSHIATLYY